jgi:ferritin-like metal-binding protein YciE
MRNEPGSRQAEGAGAMEGIAAADMDVTERTVRREAPAGPGSLRPDRMLPERGTSEGIGDRISDLLNVRSLDDLGRQVREHPYATLAVVAGAGFLLQRAGVVRFFSDAIGDAMRDSKPDWLSPHEERLLSWLNNAYALEKALIPILQNHAKDARRRPAVRRRDLEHLEQTRQHVRMVRRCIEELGAKPSRMKSAIGQISGMLNAMTTEPFEDEVVRNFLADYSAENLEIASYRAIIAAAREAGHPKIARICGQILEEEEAMADWLYENLPREVRQTFAELHGSGDRQSR